MAWAASAETPAAGTIGTVSAKGFTRARRVSRERASRARILATDGGRAMASDPQHHEHVAAAHPTARRGVMAVMMRIAGGNRHDAAPGLAGHRGLGRLRRSGDLAEDLGIEIGIPRIAAGVDSAIAIAGAAVVKGGDGAIEVVHAPPAVPCPPALRVIIGRRGRLEAVAEKSRRVAPRGGHQRGAGHPAGVHGPRIPGGPPRRIAGEAHVAPAHLEFLVLVAQSLELEAEQLPPRAGELASDLGAHGATEVATDRTADDR